MQNLVSTQVGTILFLYTVFETGAWHVAQHGDKIIARQPGAHKGRGAVAAAYMLQRLPLAIRDLFTPPGGSGQIELFGSSRR